MPAPQPLDSGDFSLVTAQMNREQADEPQSFPAPRDSSVDRSMTFAAVYAFVCPLALGKYGDRIPNPHHNGAIPGA